MKLASLFSGGKDSAFSCYLAQEAGYETSCLLNIVSKNGESWMFHVPNQNCVPAMAEAMGLPLFTEESDGSEKGDLDALRKVLKKAKVDGVVTGAIWSDYQWERINAVCGELDLFVYCPLWRKNQDMVYDEMVSAGIEAVIAGTFAEGLDSSWLGTPLNQETKTKLKKLESKYGVSIMGEGGEYESLVMNSPMFSRKLKLKKKKITEKSSYSVMDAELL